jgi:hypothetical protein
MDVEAKRRGEGAAQAHASADPTVDEPVFGPLAQSVALSTRRAKHLISCQARFAKIFLFPKYGNRLIYVPSRAHRGRVAIVTNVGCGMRWTLLVRRRCTLKRTVKPCGPGTSTLVSSLRAIRKRRGLTSPIPRGEHGVSRKAIAQGVPDRFGEPVVTLLVGRLPFSAHEAAGALSARHSLRPLHREGRNSCKARAQIAPRECLLSSRASEHLAARSPVKSRARPGTHNHRAMLFYEVGTPSLRNIKACGYGSPLPCAIAH